MCEQTATVTRLEAKEEAEGMVLEAKSGLRQLSPSLGEGQRQYGSGSQEVSVGCPWSLGIHTIRTKFP